MDKKTVKVLKTCIEKARGGEPDINVFDLMYETSLKYPELKSILDKLVLKRELAAIDIKTYSFIGDPDRKFEEAETPSDLKNDAATEDDECDAVMRAHLERRRAEIIEAMRKSAYDEDDEDESSGKRLNTVRRVAKPKPMTKAEESEMRVKALRLCIEKQCVTMSLLLKSFAIGYSAAFRLIDWMEENGYIVCRDGEPRKVVITLEDFEKTFGKGAGACDKEVAERESDNEMHDASDEQKKKFKEFFINLSGQQYNVKKSGDAPEHPSWKEEDALLDFCADKLTAVILSGTKIRKAEALIKIEEELNKVRDLKLNVMIEVYERLYYELTNMNNYYFIKLRGLLVAE